MAVADDSPLMEPVPEGPTAGDLSREELDSALLVLVVNEAGETAMWTKDHVADEPLADHLVKLAETVRSGEHRRGCAACRAGHTSHGH